VNPDPDKRYPSVQECHDALAGYLERIWPGRSWWISSSRMSTCVER